MQIDDQLAERIKGWVKRFKYYREPPDEAALAAWLARFAAKDRKVAAKVLDRVAVVSAAEIQSGYRSLLQAIPSWDPEAAKRTGRWFFVGFGYASESGAAMLREFREANNLSAARHNHLFASLADLPDEKLTPYDTVVFVDDFSGTGDQVTKAWPTVEEVMGAHVSAYLLLTAMTEKAADRIAKETSLRAMARITLPDASNVFDVSCSDFSDQERRVLEKYGKLADAKRPRGHGECGLLFVLSHKTPNNTLPILHANHKGWRGPFPRYLNAA